MYGRTALSNSKRTITLIFELPFFLFLFFLNFCMAFSYRSLLRHTDLEIKRLEINRTRNQIKNGYNTAPVSSSNVTLVVLLLVCN